MSMKCKAQTKTPMGLKVERCGTNELINKEVNPKEGLRSKDSKDDQKVGQDPKESSR